MKVIIALVAIVIAIADTSNVPEDTDVTTKDDEHNITPTSASEESGPQHVTANRTTVTTSVHRLKKPVFKVVQKTVKIKNNRWNTTTRRPSLMKHIKFTIDPLTYNNHRFSINRNKQADKDDIQRSNKIHQFRKTINTSNEDDSSEETSETSTAKERRKDKIKNFKALVRRFHKLGSKISNEKNAKNTSQFNESVQISTSNDSTTGTNKPTDSEFSSEENEDRKEFIFVTPNTIKEHTVTVMENSDESSETSTFMIEKEIKSRQKRSINVIEEENLGTTVSGFKFTGKIASLSSDLVFRNINT